MTASKQRKSIYDLRTRNSQEVVGKMPSWIIRLGSSFLLILLLLIVLCAWLIRIPEVVNIEFQTNLNKKILTVEIPNEKGLNIRPQQKVLIKFEMYPFDQYGGVIGQIDHVEYNPTLPLARIYICVLGNSSTARNFTFPSDRMLKGHFEIIVNEERVLKKIFRLSSE